MSRKNLLNSKSLKRPKVNGFLLFNIVFWHLLATVMSIHISKLRYPYLDLTKINYWFWILSWWSYLTSFLTITWVIWKLVNKKSYYFSQIFDLVITNINVVDTVFIFGLIIYYCGGGKFELISSPPKEKWVEIYWVIVNFLWHIIAPGLVIYYFLKFSQTDLLEKKLKKTLLSSLVFPTFYFLYVILRPVIDNYYSEGFKLEIANLLNSNSSQYFPSSNLKKLRKIYRNAPQAYQMPKDYPYPFFFRCASKQISYSDKVSKFPQLVWIIGTFLIWFLIFSLLSYSLIYVKKKYIAFSAKTI